MNEGGIVRLFPDRRGETSDPDRNGARPVVYTDEQPREILQNTLAVVREGNDPRVLFRCADRLVRLCSNGDRETAHPVPLSKHGLYRLLIELADWRKRTANGETASSPPSRILDAILEDAGQSVPELDVFTTVPMFGKDFELMDTPGYHANERLYFQDVHGLGDIGSDRMDVAEARGLLMEAICDFPFTEEAGKAHAIGLMLLPFIRRAIGAGSTPLHVIGSACPGSGKGRLADLVSVIATGESCTPTTLGAGAYENAKKLTSLLLAGTLAGCPIVLLDNIPQDRILDDAALASVLTSTRPTDRLLGGNRMATLRNQAVWILTANNLRCTTEISRRSVRIRIDPQTDRPWLRSSFLHGDVLEWARRNRRSLVRACVSLVLAWIEVGRPRWKGTPLGSFEEWSAVLGGILEVAEIHAFLGNAEIAHSQADPETAEWRALMDLWWERFGSAPVRTSDLHGLCLRSELLAEVLGFGGLRSQVSRLGRALNRHVDRVFGAFQLQQDAEAVRSSARYMLTPVRHEAVAARGREAVDSA